MIKNSEVIPLNQYELNLLKEVCKKLDFHDKYHRGLISAENFNLVIRELGIQYGSYEMDVIMRFCIITKDGYVCYKYMLIETLPLHKAQNMRDNVYYSLNPPEIILQEKFDPSKIDYNYDECLLKCFNSTILTPEKAEQLRRLYAQWDKGNIKDYILKEYLQKMGFSLSFEFERNLASLGPSRSLSFSRMVNSLLIENIMSNRRARKLPFHTSTEKIKSKKCPLKNRSLDLISWRDTRNEQIHLYEHGLAIKDNKNILNNENFDIHNIEQNINLLVLNFLEDQIPCSIFRWKLGQLGIEISEELNFLIRSHEADNQGSFREFIKTINLYKKRNIVASDSKTTLDS